MYLGRGVCQLATCYRCRGDSDTDRQLWQFLLLRRYPESSLARYMSLSYRYNAKSGRTTFHLTSCRLIAYCRGLQYAFQPLLTTDGGPIRWRRQPAKSKMTLALVNGYTKSMSSWVYIFENDVL